MFTALKPFLLVFVLFLLGACASSQPGPEMLTVEGTVSVRGNAPFTAYLLETDAQNRYILVLDDATRSALTTPARVQVTGRLYRDDWNGTPYAHLEVMELIRR